MRIKKSIKYIYNLIQQKILKTNIMGNVGQTVIKMTVEIKKVKVLNILLEHYWKVTQGVVSCHPFVLTCLFL